MPGPYTQDMADSTKLSARVEALKLLRAKGHAPARYIATWGGCHYFGNKTGTFFEVDLVLREVTVVDQLPPDISALFS